MTPQPNKKAVLIAKYPRVFQGLGKLKGFQLKLHINPNVKPLAQPIRRIPFSRRQKRNEKLGELEKLGVIEKVDTPTSWINPLVAVEKVWQVLKDCLGTHNLHDDILVVGKDKREHDANLEKTLQKLEESGLTLNYDKCLVGVNNIAYMGDILSSDGLQLSEERVKAIAEAPAPKNQFEMRSFLGSIQFCAKFIPQFATISAPLWDLTSKMQNDSGAPKKQQHSPKLNIC